MTTEVQKTFAPSLEAFIASDDFYDGIVRSTKASWGGSRYNVELFEDGSWRVLWDNEIGNLYQSSGILITLPTLDDDDYHESLDNMSEEEYFSAVFENDREELEQELRNALAG